MAAASGAGVRLECVLHQREPLHTAQLSTANSFTTTTAVNPAARTHTTPVSMSNTTYSSGLHPSPVQVVSMPSVSRSPVVRWYKNDVELTPEGVHYLHEYRRGVCRLIIPRATQGNQISLYLNTWMWWILLFYYFSLFVNSVMIPYLSLICQMTAVSTAVGWNTLKEVEPVPPCPQLQFCHPLMSPHSTTIPLHPTTLHQHYIRLQVTYEAPSTASGFF